MDVEFHDGQLNFVKGNKGKGKGKGDCWNCGKQGRRAADCTNPPSAGKGQFGKAKGKGGKGKGKGECWNCGETGHRFFECQKLKKGKGKGQGKGGWQGQWNGVSMVCSLKEAKPKMDEDGFTIVDPAKAAKTRLVTETEKQEPKTQINTKSFEALKETESENKVFKFQSNKSVYKKKKKHKNSF